MAVTVSNITEIYDNKSDNGVIKIVPDMVLSDDPPKITLEHVDKRDPNYDNSFNISLTHEEMESIMAAWAKYMVIQDQERSALIQERKKDEAVALHGEGVK